MCKKSCDVLRDCLDTCKPINMTSYNLIIKNRLHLFVAPEETRAPRYGHQSVDYDVDEKRYHTC